jgi:hypothetical protein
MTATIHRSGEEPLEELCRLGCDKYRLEELTRKAIEAREEADRSGAKPDLDQAFRRRHVKKVEVLAREMEAIFATPLYNAMLEADGEQALAWRKLPEHLKTHAGNVARYSKRVATFPNLARLAEEALVEYVHELTGGWHFAQIARLLRLDDAEALKKRSQYFRRRR